MFALVDNPGKTEEWTHQIISEEYGTGPGGLSGNEDAGQMSAWLVLSMMGFYPVCPASGEYVLTAPSFEQVKIQLPDGKYFTVNSSNRSDKNHYIKSITKNNKSFKGRIMKHDEITKGETFLFQLSDKPGL
jgi:putative alpha-1,2-mannosidase